MGVPLNWESSEETPEVTEAKLRVLKLQEEKHKLEIKGIKRDFEEEDADGFHNRTYLFTDPFVPETVLECTRVLGQWHRLYPKKKITVILNSPGGTIFDGLALYDYLRELVDSGHEVETLGQGAVFSMTSVVLQAGTTRSMTPHSFLMIHEISHMVGGTASKIIDEAKLITRLQEPILKIYAGRSNMDVEEISRNWERRDWWLTSPEALELGFIDVIHA
jgi:ATP-dependent Clp endopeptidase proteolytic subunit ClpP